MRTLAALAICLTAALPSVQAQSAEADAGVAYEGPPPPALPALIARDDQGRMTIRAVRLTAPLRIDGQLDEAVYDGLIPISDFVQMEPDGGQPATERTDAWLFFDADHVYVSFRAWESQPERMIANEMRRDSGNIRAGDSIGFGFDTFYDRRNALLFEVNAIGGRTDGQSTNERQYSGDWNPVWELAVRRFDGGWTLEAAIPFKSIRYQPGRTQVWGFNARRVSKWKNEISYLATIPPSFGMGRGDFAASRFATLVGIEAPSGAHVLELKPFATSDLTTDLTATPRVTNEVAGDLGLDAKYGVTQNLTADFTVNTDFAQVEADEQQVNLTRFNLLFPEKRDFFLENQGTFAFASAGGGQSGGSGDTPILFYSRRIGLSDGRQVPIGAGGRLTGRLGAFSLGLLNIQTRNEPAEQVPPDGTRAVSTNFSVVRVKRDVLRRSSIGAIFTNRSVSQNLRGSNQAYGVDGTFAFFTNVFVNVYWARTRGAGVADRGSDTSYRANFEYAADRYGLRAERLVVGDAFNPEVGFVRRTNMKRTYGQARFSPRPEAVAAIRKLYWVGAIDYVQDGGGRLETRSVDGEFTIEFENSDRLSVAVSDTYEFLDDPFRIADGVRIPAGGYDFRSVVTSFTFGQQRAVSGTVLAEHGTFYDGHLTTLGFSRFRVNVTPQFSLEPSVSLNWIDLPAGSFTTRLIGSRVTYTLTPLMFASALLQYNSSGDIASANVRLRWEYRPGSELFLVYNEERDSRRRGFPDLRNRALIVKVNRLFRL